MKSNYLLAYLFLKFISALIPKFYSDQDMMAVSSVTTSEVEGAPQASS